MNGDGYADLVVGASGEAAGDVQGAGSVTVVFGDRSGLSRKAIAFHVPAPTPREHFGGRLTSSTGRSRRTQARRVTS
ncbi:integrin alpha [Streptomyces sp. NBC_00258]